MFLIAVIFAAAAGGLAIWALATGGRLLDYQTGRAAVKKNFRLWHPVIAALLLVLAPWGTSVAMSNAGKADVVGGYQQFLNGALVSADVSVTGCHEDGSCVHEYDCDPYTVHHDATYDDKGDIETPAYDTTEYHSCPEATREYTYTVTGTFGFKDITYVVGPDHIFALHPQVWRSGEEGELEGVVPRGVPADWRRYKWDLDHKNADPITAVGSYVNYVLASQDTILKAYSDEAASYLKQGLLPEHTQGFLKGDPIKDRLNAYKVNFVGFTPPDAQQWQKSLMHFNAALGMELQGDMHIVAVDDHLISSGQSETYANALKAYWQGPKMGKKSLAKNGIIVVLGVDRASGAISWARANTGMPTGNGSMISAIENTLPNHQFDAGTVLGTVTAIPVLDHGKPSVKYSLGHGLLSRIVFHDFPFARACMQCKDKTDKGTAFTYLEADIKVPFWAQFLNVFFAVLLGLVAAGAVYMTSPAFSEYQTARPTY